MGEGNEDSRWKRFGAKVRAGANKLDESPALLTAAKFVRQMAPGDSRYGDLPTAGSESPQVVGRRFAQLTEKRPGVMREAGMTALQMWQSVSEAQGRGRGDTELTIVFTDLSNFSDWASTPATIRRSSCCATWGRRSRRRHRERRAWSSAWATA